MIQYDAKYSLAPLPDLRKGSLVKTKTLSPQGLHRVEVMDVVERNGEKWAIGVNWEFPAKDLIVIRPPAKPRKPRTWL